MAESAKNWVPVQRTRPLLIDIDAACDDPLRLEGRAPLIRAQGTT
jgi:hypothetical protein